MTSFTPLPTRLTRLTQVYAVVWLLALIVWKIGDLLPHWALSIAILPSLPLGVLWIRQLRRNHHSAPAKRSSSPRSICSGGSCRSTCPSSPVFKKLNLGLSWTGTVRIVHRRIGVVGLGSRTMPHSALDQARLDEIMRNGPLLVTPASAIERAGKPIVDGFGILSTLTPGSMDVTAAESSNNRWPPCWAMERRSG